MPHQTPRILHSILCGMVICGLAACQGVPIPSEPPSSDPSITPTATALAPSATPEPASAVACEPSQPLPSPTDVPGVHPPDALLGSDEGSWQPGEGNSFEWREGNVYSEALGAPVLEPPRTVYEAPAGATNLTVAVAKPIPFESWKVVIFPWRWYDQPPIDAKATVIRGHATDGTTAICLNAPAAGEWFLSAVFDFGDGNHAKYRWHLVIPPG